jgi:hypothetical protein
MWTRSQRHRLTLEKKVLERRLPQFQFYDPTGDTYVSGVVPLYTVGLVLTLKCVLDPSCGNRHVKGTHLGAEFGPT